MRIKRLWLEEFKNLRKFELEPHPHRPTTVLLGRNGTGKSNVLEAIVMIFRDLDLNQQPSIAYELHYECRGHDVKIVGRPSAARERRTVRVNGEKWKAKDFRDHRDEILPAHVFAYYSGPSKRLERHFDQPQKRFYKALISTTEADQPPRELRRLFFARDIHSYFVLLAFEFLGDDPLSQLVRSRLRIEDVESVLFVLKQPEWSGRKRDDWPTFYDAAGVVRMLLERIYELSIFPVHRRERVEVGFNRKPVREPRMYLCIPDRARLHALAESFGKQREFFAVLESLYISDFLADVQIRVRREDGEAITFQELSEGEQQFLTVLGLLRFTENSESLFLLDEPDTHLNPNWTWDYLGSLTCALSEASTGHVLLATHDPLIVGSARREDVQLLDATEEGVRARAPDLSPHGLGFEGVLTGEFFALATTVDPETDRKLKKWRDLATAEDPGTTELDELRRLSAELLSLGFSGTVRDPMYSEYLRARARRIAEVDDATDGSDRQAIEALADELLDEILGSPT